MHLSETIKKQWPNFSFDGVEYILTYLDCLFLYLEHDVGLKKLSEGIENLKEYDNELKKLKMKIKSLKKKNQWPKIQKWFFDVPFNLIDDYSLFYRFPSRVINKVKGLSYYGSMYYCTKPLIENTSESHIELLLK
jgi:hypothetical protein